MLRCRLKDLEPNFITYNAVTTACEKGHQWQHILGQRCRLKDVGPNFVAYSAAMRTCEKGLQWQQSLSQFLGKPHLDGKKEDFSYTTAAGT